MSVEAAVNAVPTPPDLVKMNARQKSLNGSITKSKGARRFFGRLLLVLALAAIVPGHPAIAGDAERLAQCIATADLAAAAVKSRDYGIPAQRVKQAIASTDTTDAQLKEAIAIAYGTDPLTPDQASRKVLQDCLEAE
jgi:hypothetical protein